MGSRAAALLLGLRPKQWTKNLLLFAGLLFTLENRHPLSDWRRASLGFALFCLLSGCAYLLNDIRDVDADRQHPRKRNRAIASGRLPIPLARAFAWIAAPASVAAGWLLLGPAFAAAAALYFGTTLAYSLYLKNVVLLDVLTLSAGFVIRAVAGSVAVAVAPSPWLLICTFLLMLFMGLLKRRAEIVSLGAGTSTRPILAEYSLGHLDQMVTLVATTCLVAYLLYTFQSPTGQSHPYLVATSPFVLYGLFRYLYLAHQRGLGESPESVLLEDRPLQVNLLLWVAAVVAALLTR